MTELRREVRHWERLAATDPMWVILTRDDKRDGAWDPEEFFATGRAEVSGVLSMLEERGLRPRTGVALDFGCGVGRLTQALAERFDRVEGVDISSRMIALAREYNRHGPRVTYHVNAHDTLPMLADGSVDFVYSWITLQHIPKRSAERYVREFARVLAPGGVAVFQALTRARSWMVRARHMVRDAAPDAYRAVRDLVSRRARWEISVLGEAAVRRALASGGVELRFADPDDSAGAPFESRRFVGIRGGATPNDRRASI